MADRGRVEVTGPSLTCPECGEKVRLYGWDGSCDNWDCDAPLKVSVEIEVRDDDVSALR